MPVVGSFENKDEALFCIASLQSSMKKQGGILRVYDLYFLLNIITDPRDFNYGWKSTKDFTVEQRGDVWAIRVPKPALLEK